jgi:hypothetical protein
MEDSLVAPSDGDEQQAGAHYPVLQISRRF